MTSPGEELPNTKRMAAINGVADEMLFAAVGVIRTIKTLIETRSLESVKQQSEMTSVGKLFNELENDCRDFLGMKNSFN